MLFNNKKTIHWLDDCHIRLADKKFKEIRKKQESYGKHQLLLKKMTVMVVIETIHEEHKVYFTHNVSFWAKKLTNNVSFWGQKLC